LVNRKPFPALITIDMHSKRNNQISMIITKIEQILDSTPFSPDEIAVVLRTLCVKYDAGFA